MSVAPQLSRRSFLAVVGAGSASFALGSFSDFGSKSNASLEPNAFVKLDPDGLVTITVSKSEMGQGVRTSLAMIVAEQMDCDWTKVRVLQATGNREKYGPQQTWGSQSTRSMYQRLCEMGAAARMMLVDAAAKEWGVEPATCKTENGKVLHAASGRSMDFGDLASAAAAMPVPSGSIKLKERSAYRIVGKDQHRVDNRDVATGKAIFAQDVQVPGALVGVISRRPAFGATLKGFDDTETRKVPGVVDVFKVSTGVCVVAENTWAAIKGREALKPEWDLGPNATLNSAEISKRMREAVGQHPEMPAGAKVVEATYDFPYLAHYTMEPMNAIADVRADSCTVWAPSQACSTFRPRASRSTCHC
jgi:isoquinoline 1-oxidoreductase beta subunit